MTKQRERYLPGALRAVWLLGAAAVFEPLVAQPEGPPGQQALEEEKRVALTERAEYDQTLGLDYGGWVSYEFITFGDEPTRDDRTLRIQELRLWGNLRIEPVHRFYIRGLLQHTDFNHGDSFDGDDNEWRGMNLEQGFYVLDLAAAGNATPWDPLTNARLAAGRQFFHLGSGLTLNSVQDGVKAEFRFLFLNFLVSGSETIHSRSDIDQSRPEPGTSKRQFYGMEISSRYFPKQELYLLGLVQQDKNDDSPEIAQDFRYDSSYWGLGSRGQITPRLRYALEGVHQTGKSSVAGTTDDEEDIEAFGGLANLVYYVPGAFEPRIGVAYLVGSGDRNRASPTNTQEGNEAGSVDRGFLPFGYIPTGYSLFPRLSNLHIYSASLAVKPFADGREEPFERLELGSRYYFYKKFVHQGGISDRRASLSDSEVGEEVDFYLRWPVFSDLAVSVNSGFFFPSDAYARNAQETRKFVSLLFHYSF